MRDKITTLNFQEVKSTADQSSSSSSKSDDDKDDKDDKDDDKDGETDGDDDADKAEDEDKADDPPKEDKSKDSDDDSEDGDGEVMYTEDEAKDYWKSIKKWKSDTVRWGIVDVAQGDDGSFDQLKNELIVPFHTGPPDR